MHDNNNILDSYRIQYIFFKWYDIGAIDYECICAEQTRFQSRGAEKFNLNHARSRAVRNNNLGRRDVTGGKKIIMFLNRHKTQEDEKITFDHLIYRRVGGGKKGRME